MTTYPTHVLLQPTTRLDTLFASIQELELRRSTQNIVDEQRIIARQDQLEARLNDLLDSEDFRNATVNIVEDYIRNRDDLVSMDDVERFIEENVHIRVR